MIYTIVILSIAFILNIFATRKLLRSKRLLKHTIRIQIVLVWLIPFVWALLVLLYSDEPPKKNKKYGRGRYMRSGYQNYIPRSF
jgi:hypothetical protein